MIALRVIHSLHGEKLASFPVAASQFEEDDAIDTWSNIFGAKNFKQVVISQRKALRDSSQVIIEVFVLRVYTFFLI